MGSLGMKGPRGRGRVAGAMLGAVLLAGTALAARPESVWAVSVGGPAHDKARGIATDREGNVYVTGEFSQTAQFGKHTLVTHGDLDFFVAKFDRKGECLWARAGGGSLTDRGYAVAADRDQNCYVTGHYQSVDARFEAQGPLPNRGQYDIFVACYDRLGALKWIHTGGGARSDVGHGLALDGRGNCYITGGLAGKGEFGDWQVEDQRGTHMFLLKFAPDGRQLWGRASRGGSSSGQGMTADRDGNTWITGDIAGEVDYGGARRSVPGDDMVLVKFDKEGQALWAAGGEGNSGGIGTGVSVDATGAAYVGAWFKTTETVGREVMRTFGMYDVFTAKFDAEGKPVWARQAGGPTIDYCEGTIPDGRGGCYAVGCFHDGADFQGVIRHSEGNFDLYMAHYDASGKLADFLQEGGPGLDEAYCVARTGKNEAVMSGAYSGASRYGEGLLTSAGSNDVVVQQVRLK